MRALLLPAIFYTGILATGVTLADPESDEGESPWAADTLNESEFP